MTEPTPEVVTRASLRIVELAAGPFGLITLDNGLDQRKPNTFGEQGLRSIAESLDAAAAHPGVVGVGITGKPGSFAAGADLTSMARIQSYDDALAVGVRGHSVFRRLAESGVPTFAFINAAALGGGLEIALHAHYRTVSSAAPAIALPECYLGLVPGWGGTQLLPRLIGIEKALQVIIDNPLSRNRMLTGPQAAELGIADAVFEPAAFLDASLQWASEILAGTRAVTRRPLDQQPLWQGLVAAARSRVDDRLHGAAPAPYRALQLIELAATADLDTGFAAEDQALAELMLTDEMRASLYAFDLVRGRAKRPVGAPDPAIARPLTNIGVVGAGLMASQIATLFVSRLKVPVVMTDVDDERLQAGLARVHAKAGEDAALVTGGTDSSVFAGADFVIEAVFEDLAVKQSLLAELEKVVRADCVLATNTSSLSVTEMSSGLAYPGRVVGFHLFNPVGVMPLVEIVRSQHTDDPTYATAFALGAALRKTCVAVRDAPAFVVNRLLFRLFGEILRAVDEGTPPEVADAALEPLGLPMSPLQLIEFIGPAVTQHIAESLHLVFPDRFYLPGTAASGAVESTAEEVRRAALVALCDEVCRLLDEHVVEDPRDIDLCLLTGAGFPIHLGGITPYLDRAGVSASVAGRRFLPPGVASLP